MRRRAGKRFAAPDKLLQVAPTRKSPRLFLPHAHPAPGPANWKPRVFVTRIIPEAGLRQIVDGCDAEVWREPLPPPAEVLRAKVAGCDGLVALLTNRIDASLLDAAQRAST